MCMVTPTFSAQDYKQCLLRGFRFVHVSKGTIKSTKHWSCGGTSEIPPVCASQARSCSNAGGAQPYSF